ncbi:MAG: glycoside hydrolase family 9 protein [Gammaproteobacteria bacterium]|nr:MAG: glycoside hydrolase family 9 protein [Gammaproteobacteria bacterium]
MTGFTDNGDPLAEHRLHVLFAHPLPSGEDVSFKFGSQAMSFRYAADAVSSAIQVNQVGYPTAGPKYAYVGEWLGTAGPLPVDSNRFDILNRAGESVFGGPLVLRSRSDPWSGNNVYAADFSDFQSPGAYRLRVPGIGISYPFKIGDRVYEHVYKRVARLFYHSRNGTSISEPWADPGYERPGGIDPELDGVLHERVMTSPLGTGSTRDRRHPVVRGWFDAGDYGQYMTNAAPVWYSIGVGMDLAPRNFRDDDLGIPESGNGVPDLIDELEWGMDWALSMQAEDGGVYWRIASRRWDSTLPHQVDEPRLIAERTTHATAVFAAMAAIHARLVRSQRPERADLVLKAGLSAWRFVKTHRQWPPEGEQFRNPEGVSAGEYPDRSAKDALAWAAAELFRTTGNHEFLVEFDKAFGDLRLDPTGSVSFRDQGMGALWAYLMSPDPARDDGLVAHARETLLAGAEWRLRQMDAHPFRAAQHPAIQLAGWGNFAHSTRATAPLLQAWHISGDDRFRNAAWLTTGPQLGTNPQSMSYITGVGSRSPQHPLSKLSMYDNVDRPLNGIPVNGPHYHLPAIWDSTRAVNSGYFPRENPPPDALASGYPALRRYTDSELLPPMSEPTVAEIAVTAVAYGLLRDENFAFGPQTRGRPVGE